MSYFDDIQFIAAGHAPRCAAVIDQRYPKSYATQFVLSGKLYFGINGGLRTALTPPAAFWHHPRNTYQYGPLPGAHWHHFWVMFKGARGRRIIEDGFMKLSPDGWTTVRRPVEYADHFKRLVELVRNEQPRRRAEAAAVLEAMLALLTTHREPRPTSAQHRPAIERCAASVRINPNLDHDFELTAREAHLSYSHFRRLFSEYIGHSPHEYVLLCRMQRAALQLQEGARQIKDVAVEAGYADSAQFSHLFKKKIGLSPRDYRASTVL